MITYIRHLITSLKVKEKTTPFPTSATFKRNKKPTCVDVTKIHNGKVYLTLRHSRGQFPPDPHATKFAPHTLSMRMNVGRNGTSYLQRKVTYVPYSDTMKLPYLNYPAGCFIHRLNPNARCFIPKLNLFI